MPGINNSLGVMAERHLFVHSRRNPVTLGTFPRVRYSAPASEA